jgi:nitroreductase
MARDFLSLAKSRKTTYEFSDKAVKDSDVRKILEAGRWAPSCSNSQPWHFVVIKNKKTISKLIDLCYYGDFHHDPNLVIAIVFCSHCWTHGKHVCAHGVERGRIDAYLCIGTSALSMCLEADELGVSSALLSPVMEKAADILKLKTGESVPVIVGLGYEKKGAPQKKRERKSLKDLVSYEYFGGHARSS